MAMIGKITSPWVRGCGKVEKKSNPKIYNEAHVPLWISPPLLSLIL